MPIFKLPLSGDVMQSFSAWTRFFNPVGSQIGLINIDLGKSSNPAVEEAVLSDVASYGKQLGRIEDALKVLVDHFQPKRGLHEKEKEAFDALGRMLADIAEVKSRVRSTEGG